MFSKRLTLGLLAVAMTSLVITATTFALFTASTTNTSNTFTAGTVTLGAPASTMLDVSNIAPGDLGTSTFTVSYTGSLDAWLGAIPSLSGGLTTCDGGGKFTVDITDGINSYVANGTTQVVSKVSTGAVVAFTNKWSLNVNAGNDCQGKGATLALQVIAVQAKNNTNAGNTAPLSWS